MAVRGTDLSMLERYLPFTRRVRHPESAPSPLSL